MHLCHLSSVCLPQVPRTVFIKPADTIRAALALDQSVSSLDRSVGATGSVVPDFHAYCTLVDPSKNHNKFYTLQIVEAGGLFYLFKKWGRIGSAGQCSLTPAEGNSSKATIVREFHKTFKSKTGVDWAHRAGYSAQNKYQFHKGESKAVTSSVSVPTTAHACCLLGLFDEAIQLARQELDLRPSSSDTIQNLGYVTLARRALEESECMLRRAVKIPGTTMLAYANLGLCLSLQRGRSRLKEEKEVEELIAKVKGSAEVTRHQGAIWQYRNNLAKVWELDAADDDTGELIEDVVIVNDFASRLA